MLLDENSLFGENSLSELPPFPWGPLGARDASLASWHWEVLLAVATPWAMLWLVWPGPWHPIVCVRVVLLTSPSVGHSSTHY